MTLLPILGALYGEKDSNGQRLTLRYGMIVTVALSVLVLIVSEAIPVQLAALYGLTDPAVAEIFAVTFRIFSINIPILAVIYVMRTFFQATKQRGLANLLVMLDGVLTIVPLMYWFAHYDIYWLWLSFPVSKAITVIITLIAMLISKKVKNKKSLLGIEEEDGIVFDFYQKRDPPGDPRLRGSNGFLREKQNTRSHRQHGRRYGRGAVSQYCDLCKLRFQ